MVGVVCWYLRVMRHNSSGGLYFRDLNKELMDEEITAQQHVLECVSPLLKWVSSKI